jgi:hypothetical protein
MTSLTSLKLVRSRNEYLLLRRGGGLFDAGKRTLVQTIYAQTLGTLGVGALLDLLVDVYSLFLAAIHINGHVLLYVVVVVDNVLEVQDAGVVLDGIVPVIANVRVRRDNVAAQANRRAHDFFSENSGEDRTER